VFNRWVMTLDAGGSYLRHLAQPVPWGPRALKWRCSQADAQAKFLLMGAAQRQALQEALRDEFEQAFLFCLALMHCDNVQEVELPPSPPVVHKRKNHSGTRPGTPEIRYKTLTVTPPRAAQQRGIGEQGANGAGEAEPKALHFVRGHFKDYSVKGLFGKYKKVYWWDSQVRGEVSGGVVDKDYRVKGK
jgi:hypothetical protein